MKVKPRKCPTMTNGEIAHLTELQKLFDERMTKYGMDEVTNDIMFRIHLYCAIHCITPAMYRYKILNQQ